MRERKSIGLLDVFVLILILLSVVGIVLRMQALRIVEENDARYHALARVQMLHAETAECIEVGDLLYTADGTVYGRIEAVEVTPADVKLQSDGRIYLGAWDEKLYVDVKLEISVEGRISEGAFLRDGKHALLVGEDIQLRSDLVSFHAIVYQVQPV